jgi:hypothetical protein
MERSSHLGAGKVGSLNDQMQAWYFAECQICVPIKPAPFRVEVIRDRLASFHERHTGHYVATWAELLMEL